MAGIAALSNGLAGTLRTAEALVGNSRRIDLGGLDERVRDLCAGMLTLPPARSAMLRHLLLGLMTRTDCLITALRAAAPPPAR